MKSGYDTDIQYYPNSVKLSYVTIVKGAKHIGATENIEKVFKHGNYGISGGSGSGIYSVKFRVKMSLSRSCNST